MRAETDPTQSASVASSNEKAVRLPEQTKVERRAATRYPLTLAVRYVIPNRHSDAARTGLGLTVDLSTSGVRFATDISLKPRIRVKLFIDWPVLLDGAVGLQLTIEGRVVRSGDNEVCLRIERHGFRTRGRWLKTA